MKRALALLLLLTACAAQAATRPTRTITVFAAASLSKAFAAEATAYERLHPGTRVTFSFAGSQSLVAQVQQGAPASVLATADVETIKKVTSAYQVFAHNQLAMITAPSNPKRVLTLADLGRPGVKVVLADVAVPAGKAAARALAKAHIAVHPVSLEDSVSGVVTKVRLGEADAGIAYVTDVGDGVVGTPLPGTTTTLAIAALEPDGADFVAFVESPQGQQILRQYKFR